MYLLEKINWSDHLSTLQQHVQIPPPSPDNAGQPVSAQSGWDQPDSIQPEEFSWAAFKHQAVSQIGINHSGVGREGPAELAWTMQVAG